MHKFAIIKKVNELPERITKMIPEYQHESKVFFIKNNSKSKTGSEVVKFLNKRFLLGQLGMEQQKTDHREVFYMVRKKLKGHLDIKGNSDQQYISLSNMITTFYRKVKRIMGYDYWGISMDLLKTKSKGIAIIYDTQMNTTTLTMKNLEDFKRAPFFFIICEKEETLRSTMEEMINRGYNTGFYGIALGRYATSHTIRLLIELAKVRKFYTFIMHDLDVNGLMIFFNMAKWIQAESIGINLKFLDVIGVDFDEISEDYSPLKRDLKGSRNMVRKLGNGNREDDYYEWIESCEEERIELNSLTALRLHQDPTRNKARDFADYLIHKLEHDPRIFDLNRYRSPDPDIELIHNPPIFERPDFIDNAIWDVQNTAEQCINDYLYTRRLHSSYQWKSLLNGQARQHERAYENLYALMEHYLEIVLMRKKRQNRNFDGSVKDAETVLMRQERELRQLINRQQQMLIELKQKQRKAISRALKKTPEYSEVKERIRDLRDEIIDTLEGI